MRYEQTKKLSNREFKRLVGVQRRTFNEMVKVLQDAASVKRRGCPNKLDLEDQALICLTIGENIGLTSILLKIGRCLNQLFAVQYNVLRPY